MLKLVEKLKEDFYNARFPSSFRTIGGIPQYDDVVLYKRAVEILSEFEENVKEKLNTDWVPVESGMPTEKGWYLCTCFIEGVWDEPIVRKLYYYPALGQFVDNVRYECNGLKDIEKFYWTGYVTAWRKVIPAYTKE